MTKTIKLNSIEEIYNLVLLKIKTLENECEKLKYFEKNIGKKRELNYELYNLHEIRRKIEALYIY